MTAAFRLEVLSAAHDRSTFASGDAALDRYFREQVTQDVRRRATACYVAVEATTSAVAGYYTLAASGVPLGEMPEALSKRLPRYPLVPVARLGRLAVATSHRGRRLGSALLANAALRAIGSEVAVFALAVDAKDEVAAAFYLHHGFIPYGSEARQMMLPLASFGKGRS